MLGPGSVCACSCYGVVEAIGITDPYRIRHLRRLLRHLQIRPFQHLDIQTDVDRPMDSPYTYPFPE